MDEALAGHADWIDVEMEADGFVTVTDNGRGMPVDLASQVQEQVGARSDHDDAARRRQIRFRSLRDLGRSARRRRLGRQRALGAHGGRGRARADALSHGVRARQAEGQAGEGRPRAKPARHESALPSRPGDLRQERAFPPRAHLQDVALQGLPLRRRRDQMVVRAGTAARRRERPREGDVPFRRRPQGLSQRAARRRDAGASRHLHRQRRQDRQARRGRMGGGLDRRHGRLPLVLLQHHPDAGRRHARIRACAARSPRA